MGEPEPTNVAPTCGREKAHGRAKGREQAKRATPPRGQARSASLEPEYESKGPTNPVPPSLAPNFIPSIQELLLRVLARLEGASPASVIFDAPASTMPASASIAPTDPPMTHVRPSSVL